MPFEIIRQDITKMRVDAIVNSTSQDLFADGGADLALHRAAGPGLAEACRMLGSLGTGEAKITGGYDLPAKYVIHTVGPVWQGGGYGEEILLNACYVNCLTLARQHRCASVAFPLISSGSFGVPKELAVRVARDAIVSFLRESDEEMTVYLVVYGRSSYLAGSRLYRGIRQYIDDNYVREHAEADWLLEISELFDRAEKREEREYREPAAPDGNGPAAPEQTALPDLKEYLGQLDEGFAQMVDRKMKELNLSAPEVYNRANLDKKTFSKMRTQPNYRPSKQTACALAAALKLPLKEARELIAKGGYSLTHSSLFDLILEYCFLQGQYDVFEINEILFDYDQPLLGSKMT